MTPNPLITDMDCANTDVDNDEPHQNHNGAEHVCQNHVHSQTNGIANGIHKTGVPPLEKKHSSVGRSHSLFLNNALCPCSVEVCRSRERLRRTQRHPKPSAFRNFSKKQVYTLLTLAIGAFISYTSMSIMAPFFPKEASKKGMGISLAGFVFSFYALVEFMTSPVFGKILPKVGARSLYLWGMLLAGASNVLFGFLPLIEDYTWYTTYCFLTRGFEALGASAFSTASFVFVVEVFPDNVSAVLGILETFTGLGMSVGPAIGGLFYSIGGFGPPFFTLGIVMVSFVPINWWLLPPISGSNKNARSGSLCKLLKIPSVFVVGLIIVISSTVWSFLDPTLEPHLRELSLSSREVGLVFLLFSAVYGVFSSIWGCVADRVNNHWGMMVIGLLVATIGLLLIGPSPILLYSRNTISLNLIGLCVLAVSVALTLMPTFQSLLQDAIANGHKKELATYSLVAGAWSCMYSLGEVIGPTAGGLLLDSYGFPLCSTVMAAVTLAMAVIGVIFFVCCSGQPAEIERDRQPLLVDQKVHYYGIARDSVTFSSP